MKNKVGMVMEGKVVGNIYDEKRDEEIRKKNKESDE